jgi:hypothetical protein
MNSKPLVFLAVGMAVTLPLLYFIAQGRFGMAGLIVLLVVILLIFRRLDLWWMLAVMTIGSNLHIMTQNASIHLLSMFIFVALGCMSVIMVQGRGSPESSIPRKAIYVFLATIVVTASTRGWGLRILGSANWGGMQYIQLITAAMFFMLSGRVNLTQSQIWRSLMGLGLLSLLPIAAGFFLLVVPGGSYIRFFIGAGADVALEGIALGQQRILAGAHLSVIWLVLLGMLLYDRFYRMSPPVIFLGVLSIVLIGLTGFRSLVVIIALVIITYLIVRRRSIPASVYYRAIFALFVGLVAIYTLVPYLPITFQRAFAFLPGLRVAHDAAITAAGTTAWRIEMWRLMLPMIPNYLLIGRGLGFNLAEAYAAYSLISDLDRYQFFIATHNYHNGPLWLLLDLGVVGFISASVFMFGGIRYYRKALKVIPDGTKRKSAYVVIYCFFVGNVIYFFTVIGGVAGFIRMLIAASIMEVILKLMRKEKALTGRPESREPFRNGFSGNAAVSIGRQALRHFSG